MGALDFWKNLSPKDRFRLMQCVCCERDLDTCEVDDDDEAGFCRQYEHRPGAPDVEIKRPERGHWIYSPYYGGAWECSACHKFFSHKADVCPACMAIMGEEDSDDKT